MLHVAVYSISYHNQYIDCMGSIQLFISNNERCLKVSILSTIQYLEIKDGLSKQTELNLKIPKSDSKGD